MGTVIPFGYASARFVHRCNGVQDPMGFSIGFDVGSGPTRADLAADLASSYSGMIWGVGANASEQYTFVGVNLTTTLPTGPIVDEFQVNVQGDLVQGVPTPNLSILVTKQTAAGGRKNRGRIFAPTATLFETEVDQAGVISGGARTALQDAWSTWFDNFATLGTQPVILHSDPADTPAWITGFFVQSLCATQRRRMR